ncbi:MAG TPA: DinB family protein [Chloroflexota bacterium]|nr:DinB family protein [Chloroflexota bacterium]
MNQPVGISRLLNAYAETIRESISGVIACLDGLDAEQVNWRPNVEGANSLWVLAVHVVANAEQAILSLLGGAPDTRDREAEFAAQSQSPDAARDHWATALEGMRATILGLTPADLEREYTHPRRGVMSGHQLLLLVIQHASEHRGHAGLTRDLLLARS